jgi:4-amino-4-deoxy-L-arabinose transferase-like glycosyltransferase
MILGLTVPFLNKPFHIDDTFVLSVSSSILKDYWDPFSGQIDWFGTEIQVWKATTNPPLLSYYLAPIALFSDYSEIALHVAMLPYFLILALGMHSLARRFTSSGYWPVLFLMTSVAVVVSGNVMRDVPGTGLAVAGVAAFIWGSDHQQKRWLCLGVLLVGLAVLTKYSAAVVLPVMALYVLFRRKPKQIAWLTLAGILLGGWCLHNWLVYGQAHILYLFLEGRSGGGIVWQDKLFGALAVLGSTCLLFPALIFRTAQRRHWLLMGITVVLAFLAGWGVMIFYEPELDCEYLFWIAGGAIVLSIPVIGAVRLGGVRLDSCFLVAWCVGVIWFSVFMVPFQAVRHLLPALPPLILLGFRYLGASRIPRAMRTMLTLLLLTQALLAGVVQLADYEYAASYRSFAEDVSEERASSDTRMWYVGHWGWMFYAERAGFRQLHRDGPFPEPGDLLLWPEKVHVGNVFRPERFLWERLEVVSQHVNPGIIPARTMDRGAGAGFYSVTYRKLPYRLFPEGPVEVMRTYRVTRDRQPSPQ